LEIQNAVIDILVGAFGANYITIIKNTLTAISKLASGDGRIKAFDKNTRGDEHGVFQMGMAVETNNAVTLQLGSFMIKTSDKSTNILFIKFDKSLTSVNYATHQATFNTGNYNGIRDKIITKLGIKASQYIDELEI
jgi:hypothetical protein